MIEFVKVVKVKSAKLLGARAHARVREPSHQAKREEKIWMREKGKSARAVGDKIVRAISKKVGEKRKTSEIFQKTWEKIWKISDVFSEISVVWW